MKEGQRLSRYIISYEITHYVSIVVHFLESDV